MRSIAKTRLLRRKLRKALTLAFLPPRFLRSVCLLLPPPPPMLHPRPRSAKRVAFLFPHLNQAIWMIVGPKRSAKSKGRGVIRRRRGRSERWFGSSLSSLRVAARAAATASSRRNVLFDAFARRLDTKNVLELTWRPGNEFLCAGARNNTRKFRRNVC